MFFLKISSSIYILNQTYYDDSAEITTSPTKYLPSRIERKFQKPPAIKDTPKFDIR